METLTSLSTKIFSRNYSNKTQSSKTLLGRSDVRLLRSLHINDCLTQLVASCRVASDAKGFETAENRVQAIERIKNVHLKFQLQKECLFGEQILLVGSDPIIGLWDSSRAIHMNWSNGRIWTAEIYMPIDLSIKFKFILKGSTGDLLWQPGPDRIFQTWETNNTIIIAEDWENAKLQAITEENKEELWLNSGLEPAIFHNASDLIGDPLPLANEDIMFKYHFVNAKDKPVINGNNAGIKAEKTAYRAERPLINTNKELNVEDHVISNKEKCLEDEVTLLLNYEEGPVLVPGLTPLNVSSTEKEL